VVTRTTSLKPRWLKIATFLLLAGGLLTMPCRAAGPPPVITAQPQDQAVPNLGSATFTVEASSGTLMTYQWRKNGTNITGAILSSYTILAATASDVGSYSVRIVNAGGSVTSTNATLTLLVPPTITAEPQSQTGTQGLSRTFTVAVSGSTPLAYQWKFNGTDLSGATNSSLQLTNLQTSQAGDYSVLVTNPQGSDTSATAALTVLVPPSITASPGNQAVVRDQSASFTVNADGTSPVRYQWRFNGASMAGATNSTLLLSNVQSSQAGNYTVVVSNSAGVVTSAVATLTVYVPAGISTQPQSQIGTQGLSRTLSVVASGTAPFSYQWSFNGTALVDATNATRAFASLQTTDAGDYSVAVGNPWGAVTSTVATLTVLVPPAITTPPQNQAVVRGQTATFTAAASGTMPLTYQWRLNGSSVAGATNATLALSNVQSNQTGNYIVVVNNSAGSVTSSVAVLTVYVPAAITTQPQSQTTTQGWSRTFSVVPSGTAPFSYQWSMNGVDLTGGTNALLLISNPQTNDAGAYRVVVANDWGSATSSVANLTVLVPPAITTPPQTQTAVKGQTPIVTVIASGSTPFTYQWRFNGSPLSGATNAMLALSNVQSNQAGNYDVVVNNPAGSVTSSVAVLTVYVPAGIATQPQSQVTTQGWNRTLSVVANGTVPFTYQWSFNGVAMTDATNASLPISSAQTSDAGTYQVVVANAWGSATSAVATLTVLVPPGIATPPQSQTAVKGQTPTFTVTASGSTPFAYQWRFNGSPLSGATNAMLALSNVQSNQAGNYDVVVNNPAGSVTSSVAVLTVYVPAGVATQPQSQTTTQGWSRTFSVVPSGTAPFSYQWSFNGNLLNDATNASLLISNPQTNDAGAYRVVVANAWGSVTSSVATLTVLVPAGIASSPQSLAVVRGQTATFTVTASGTAPFGYRWRLNGSPLSTATNAVLALSNVQSNQAGNYDVVITNSAGAVTSSVAVLTVYVPAGIVSHPLSQTATQGQTVTFSVGASGTAPFAYQWQYLNRDIAGATNASLAVPSVLFVQAGAYAVKVTNAWGGAASSNATLLVVPPAGSDVPLRQGLVAYLNFDGDLRDSSGRGNHATAVGAPAMVPGFIGAGGFSPFTAGNTNNYATFGNPVDLSFGKDTDFSVSFWVRLPAGAWNGGASRKDPAFLGNKDWSSGDNVGWVIAAGDNGRLQWNYTENANQSRKDYDGPGSLFGNPVWHQVAVTFERTVRAITYVDGMAVSTNSIGPGTKYIDSGLPTNVGNDGTGDYPTGYGFWTNVLNDPASGLNMDEVALWNRLLTAQEICAIYNVGLDGRDLGSIASPNLTTSARPRITTSPVSLAVNANGSALFNVTASGTALTYQWYANGAAIIGATGSSLMLSNIQPAQAGSYYVRIANTAGNVTSDVATLTVNAPPSITSQPQSQTSAPGQTVTFSVVATATGSMSYQWKHNGVNLTGANSPMLTLTNLQANNAGNYTVVITNSVGATTSLVATLTVTNPAPSLSVAGGGGITPQGFVFQTPLPPGVTYVVLASTNLVDWSPIMTDVAASPVTTIIDTQAVNFQRRFYRIMLP
jgi:hypothetical protein